MHRTALFLALALASSAPSAQPAPSDPARQSVTTPSGISLEVEF